ncbi:methionine aminopeptidase [Clostridium pasteurianum DSM 525 = ATCC 6013]|uniref:Methionine aminopeptidase n=1 Tax=Clostridium pasteurianum DSM 525 = ATCC 6013 TaxID=1262449 RepID=A0A0H3J5Z5_CLOPA|nr:type I methionyl aminopeptidase [Clostridium pasteurianum]AJA47323.1 methionine aminopeptidase [Clostridium pasteurianum DSM 525 = ATCC 6013]AJA51311.1 methionine aminopeptidase [Clostridium pasteurianum DSM 525 = ATCC 6013]AOZ74659.1 methionine aminopeptidase [Clostridium pasteurianum DSM 525 = ATCC 6013]AOZ78456.1 methionine aminopeptidase [Clostridium pasteurianum]ELP58660.1 methionine aminopeptidase [Clostridium pasteurianum DSM 525 = ATCC 6013]
MIEIKTKQEIEYMREAGKILAACHKEIKKMIKPGITTMEIDAFVEKFLKKYNATPEEKGYMGYPYATCASVNDEICHGFPTKKPLKEGDIVTIDMVVNLNGWLADSAWSYAIGKISKEAENLMKVTKECLYRGIKKAVPGNHIGDIGYEIQTYAESLGYSVVRDYTGHGIGKKMHDDIAVPHYGRPGRGIKLREGMVITIEPMINIGTYETVEDSNGWTARTADGSLSAQYEHTLAITEDGPIILTEQD